MDNNFINALRKETNYDETENGAVAHKSTLDAVYDLFALGGAYRNRSDEDCILLFKNAYEQDPTLALKCLFYLRDIRGGQGERRFFRVCFKWLAQTQPEAAFRNIDNVPEYGRWDDLYCLNNTDLAFDAYDFMYAQFIKDIRSYSIGPNEGISLLAKWLKSENAHSAETKMLGNNTRIAFGLTHKDYRKASSMLRERINIVERLMSENRWDEIEFDKIPSRAGLIYRNAFAHKDLIADKYAEFMASKTTKVNAGALFPYDIVAKATDKIEYAYWNNEAGYKDLDDTERNALNKYWENQKDYLNGKPCKMMCVIDTSGSMTSPRYRSNVAPMDIAISLGMYCAERIGGPLKNYFISFSSRPQLIKVEGIDFCDKVRRIYSQNLCENTDLKATFDLLLKMYTSGQITADDMPETLVIISDMQIDCGSYWRDNSRMKTDMELLREEWANAGLRLPKLVYWNCDAREDTILDDPNNSEVTFVSGCSPTVFESVITGQSGIQVMLNILNSKRYENVK